MSKLIKHQRSKKAGLPPGTPVHIGETKIEPVRISLIDYDQTQLTERPIKNIEETFPLRDKPSTTWVNIDGLQKTELIEQLGTHYKLHPLTIEDIVNTTQRPKIEEFERYTYIVFQMIAYDTKQSEVTSEQVSLVIGKNFLLTFQEGRPGDVFDVVRERIRKSQWRMRKLGADYLAYSLLDAAIDSYFGILEQIGESIDSLEEELLANPRPQTIQAIHRLKRELILLRRSIWPLREVVGHLTRTDSKLISKETVAYLRDIHDHIIQVVDTLETFRDIASGMLDMYLSGLSNRMNEVMKVLTIFASIFIPLTFLAGVYGMNFVYFPELHWRWGYPAFWIFSLALSLGMIAYFKRKKWL